MGEEEDGKGQGRRKGGMMEGRTSERRKEGVTRDGKGGREER